MASTADFRNQRKVSNSKNIFEYLKCLPPSSLLLLYDDETYGVYACKAVLQSALPELARQYVYRLAVCGGEFSRDEVALWHTKYGTRDAAAAIERMEDFGILEKNNRTGVETNSEGTSNEENAMMKLTAEFRKGITRSVFSLNSIPWESVPAEVVTQMSKKFSEKTKKQRTPPTLEDLENYTLRRWESVLHYLVGSDSVEDPPEGVKVFLESTGLMQDDPDYQPSKSAGSSKPPLIITSKGYEFMLQETHVQMWQFVLQLLISFDKFEQAKEMRKETLLFLIAMSYCKVGEGYLTNALPEAQQGILKFFKQLGLLYTYKASGNATLFYPTRVAVSLVAGGFGDPISNGDDNEEEHTAMASTTKLLESALSRAHPSSSHIAIIVQTNFQVCAYTTSPLHLSMLGLFCDVTNFRRMANVIFYKITRDSVKDAFRLGITATQILRFLRMHAHPRLRTGDQSLIPSNVEDQVWLWDRERRRVSSVEVYTHQCGSRDEFEAVQIFAKDHDAYAWGSAIANKIMIKYDKAEYLLAYIRHWKGKKAQRMNRARDEKIRKQPSWEGR